METELLVNKYIFKKVPIRKLNENCSCDLNYRSFNWCLAAQQSAVSKLIIIKHSVRVNPAAQVSGSPGNLPTQTACCCGWTPCGCSSPGGSQAPLSGLHPSQARGCFSGWIKTKFKKKKKQGSRAGPKEAGRGQRDVDLLLRLEVGEFSRTCFSGSLSCFTPPISWRH